MNSKSLIMGYVTVRKCQKESWLAGAQRPLTSSLLKPLSPPAPSLHLAMAHKACVAGALLPPQLCPLTLPHSLPAWPLHLCLEHFSLALLGWLTSPFSP